MRTVILTSITGFATLCTFVFAHKESAEGLFVATCLITNACAFASLERIPIVGGGIGFVCASVVAAMVSIAIGVEMDWDGVRCACGVGLMFGTFYGIAVEAVLRKDNGGRCVLAVHACLVVLFACLPFLT